MKIIYLKGSTDYNTFIILSRELLLITEEIYN